MGYETFFFYLSEILNFQSFPSFSFSFHSLDTRKLQEKMEPKAHYWKKKERINKINFPTEVKMKKKINLHLTREDPVILSLPSEEKLV